MLNFNSIVISAPIENVEYPRNPLSKNLINSNSYYDYYSTTASPSAWDALSDGAKVGIIAAIVGFLILVTLIIICTKIAYDNGNEEECNDLLCRLSCCLYCCLEVAVESQNNHRTCHHRHNCCCCNKF